MPRGRPIAPLELNDEQQSELTSISRSRSLPSSLVQRAKIILGLCRGHVQRRRRRTHGPE